VIALFTFPEIGQGEVAHEVQKLARGPKRKTCPNFQMAA